MLKQKRLAPKKNTPIPRTTWGKPQYNMIKGNIQRVELHRGCPWADIHEYCYAPHISEVNEDFPIPEIVRNQVEILDMNFLARKDAFSVIKKLGNIKVNGRVVYYELICGLDYRLLTQEIAIAVKQSRFVKPRLAWDDTFNEQYKIKDAITKLVKVGYKRNDIALFMIVNWRIPYIECLRKLDLAKVWNVKVEDCCYDGGYENAVPEYWSLEEINDIRLKCRKHNQLVNFGIDPQPTINQYRSGIIVPPKRRENESSID